VLFVATRKEGQKKFHPSHLLLFLDPGSGINKHPGSATLYATPRFDTPHPSWLHNAPLIHATRITAERRQNMKNDFFPPGGVTTSFPQSATRGYHAGSVLAMEDEYQASAISIDMNGAVQSYMQVSIFNLFHY
jgi:hypothetical protein